jgi:hypothetical protein
MNECSFINKQNNIRQEQNGRLNFARIKKVERHFCQDLNLIFITQLPNGDKCLIHLLSFLKKLRVKHTRGVIRSIVEEKSDQ